MNSASTKTDAFQFSVDQVDETAHKLLSAAKNTKIWLFFGDLGAGKTTLIKSLCIALGVDPHVLSSPTFSIVNEYNSPHGKIFHFDFYRMKNEVEIMDLGIEEYFDSGAYCFIEWPERLGSITPNDYFRITLTHTGSNTRLVLFNHHG
jgi:tRNA threonylcarbamoyladenosine biosynthesis protein TsaE